MNTRFLGTLCAVADTGSLAGAARAVRLSSATVAEQIQALERELDVPLIVRQGRAVTLTNEGRAVVGAGRVILAQVADLAQVARLGRLSGSLRVGSVSTALISVVLPTLKQMAERYPDVALKIVPGTSSQLNLMLDNNEIDCAITIKPSFDVSKAFGWHPIREELLTLVTPFGTDCATVEGCLTSCPIIRMHRGSPTGRIANKYLQDKGIIPKEMFEIEAAEMILTLVSQGLGVSLLPDYGFQSSAERHFRKITINDPSYARPLGVFYRRGPRDFLTNLLHATLLDSVC